MIVQFFQNFLESFPNLVDNFSLASSANAARVLACFVTFLKG